MLTDEELKELAKDELLRDVKCAALRAEQFGAHRWAKPKMKMVANKRFLKHMILNGVRSNVSREQSVKSERTPHDKSSKQHRSDRHHKDQNEKEHHSRSRGETLRNAEYVQKKRKETDEKKVDFEKKERKK